MYARATIMVYRVVLKTVRTFHTQLERRVLSVDTGRCEQMCTRLLIAHVR